MQELRASLKEAKVAIVTGGGGGIGQEVSLALAEQGYSLLVADRPSPTLNEFLKSLPDHDGAVSHKSFQGDLRDQEENKKLAHYASSMGQVSVLVNAIGISPKDDGQKISFESMTAQTWDDIIKTNLYAPFFASQAVSEVMASDGSGSIINITSVTAKTGTGGYEGGPFVPAMPSSAAYGASKAALANLTLSLSHELAGRNIRVNAVAPGYVETPMMGTAEKTNALLSTVPLGRFAKPREIASAVCYLASSEASFITGAAIEINGGWSTL